MKSENKKLRICIVVAILPPAYGGAEVAALNYANRLNMDHDSEVIVIGWDKTGLYKQSDLSYDFVYPVTLPENTKDSYGLKVYLKQYYHLWDCFRVLIKPMWKLRKEYDYVHNFNSGFAFNRVSILIAKLLNKKVITETSLVGDDDPLSLRSVNDWKDYFKPKFVRYLFYRMADRYISKSAVITEIFKKSKIPMNKVSQIPYSVDTDKFSPIGNDEKLELRKKLGLWKEGMILLFVGGINVRKGVHILLDSFIAIEKKYPDLKLMIVGPTYKYDKKYISKIKNKIDTLGLSEKVKFTEDNISNVDEYMRSSDIFILPSSKEGFPISIIEAMSCGLPVIGSDIPEIAKVQIINGKDGYLFETGNSESLAEVLESLLIDFDCVKSVRIEARKKAVANWSTEIVDRTYKELYESIDYQLRRKTILPEKGTEIKPVSGKKRIKILYTIPNFNSAGSGRALINVISGLDKNVYEPEICCRHDRGELFNSAKNLNIPIHIGEFSTFMKPRVSGLINVIKLTHFFKKINPDIIHSYNYSDDYSEALAANLSGIKWIYTKKNMSWGSNAWKIRSRLANTIIPQNNEMIIKFFKNKKNQILIPIGIDVNEFSTIKKDDTLVEKYGLTDSFPVVLTVANIIPIKGINYLIKGFSLILEDFEKAKLLIVGEDKTEFADSLKKGLKEKNLENNVIFTGKQSNIKSFFELADIFILASTKEGEGGPISILEAMASGVLCYGSDVPGIRDQFREFQDQLFESENPGSIANKILKAAEMSQEEKNFRIQKQKEFINKNYSLENEIHLLERLYSNISSLKINNNTN